MSYYTSLREELDRLGLPVRDTSDHPDGSITLVLRTPYRGNTQYTLTPSEVRRVKEVYCPEWAARCIFDMVRAKVREEGAVSDAHLTDAALAELLALHEAATPGKWRATDAAEIMGTLNGYGVSIAMTRDKLGRDARLIVAARNALPALLDEIARLRRIEAAAREHMQDEPRVGPREHVEAFDRLHAALDGAR